MSTVVQTKPPAQADVEDRSAPLVSVVIPCLNEAENIEQCVGAALAALREMGVPGEVVVADNNSEDDSARMAERAGARVVVERRRGYGSAYLAGFAASRGRYIVMADADLTYDFNEIPRFVAELENGAEMVIRASKEKLKIAEFPIEYHPRGGESKLSSFRDGWRHLRFLLVHSPTHLFIVPGALLASIGTLILVLVGGGLDIFGRAWGLHTLIAGSLLMIVGTQVLALGLCAHAYGTYFMGEKDPWFDRMRARFRLEQGLLLGGLFLLVGLVGGGVIVGTWIADGFGSLSEERLALVAATLMIVGIQIFFSSFLLSILGLRRNS